MKSKVPLTLVRASEAVKKVARGKSSDCFNYSTEGQGSRAYPSLVPLGITQQGKLGQSSDVDRVEGKSADLRTLGRVPEVFNARQYDVDEELVDYARRLEQGKVSGPEIVNEGVCPNCGYLRAVCEHGSTHWMKLSCKRRTCPVCGVKRKQKISLRVVLGVSERGGEDGSAWFTGTFDRDISKDEAVVVFNKFIRKVRIETKVHVEYVNIWERTEKGRLHCHTVITPWCYISQRVLCRWWKSFGGGRRVWIERVKDGIGTELTKSVLKMSNYMAKFDQMVLYGRGVTYSKGWPKLPSLGEPIKRKGNIVYMYEAREAHDGLMFRYELELNYWNEIRPGEYEFCLGDGCDCFSEVGPGEAEHGEGILVGKIPIEQQGGMWI